MCFGVFQHSQQLAYFSTISKIPTQSPSPSTGNMERTRYGLEERGTANTCATVRAAIKRSLTHWPSAFTFADDHERWRRSIKERLVPTLLCLAAGSNVSVEPIKNVPNGASNDFWGSSSRQPHRRMSWMVAACTNPAVNAEDRCSTMTRVKAGNDNTVT